MAALAIEGHKKLESAQQELFDAFSACFKKVNGRAVDTWQPHEMICLCSDTCFCDLIERIREEIESVSGEETQPVVDMAGVVALCQVRALILDADLTAESLTDPLFRTKVLGELLVDLQCCRLVARKICTTELILELNDRVSEESKRIVEDIAKVFDIKTSGRTGKGSYRGKGKAAASTTSRGDEKVDALEQIADAVASDAELCETWQEHLLYPEWKVTLKQEEAVKELIELFNKEYTARRKVLTRRLDVTIQAFLWSNKADEHMEQMSQAIAAIMDWRDHLGSANISLWHMFAMDQAACHDPGKVSSISALKSVIKTVIIGAVPDRGGVPEGYTVEDITKDIVKANVALRAKDEGGGRGKGSSAMAAAAMASKRWLGKGMGSPDARGAAADGGDGGGAPGGAYYSKGGGGGKGGGGVGGYYSQQDGGGKGSRGGKGARGGGGYYSQQGDGGGSGGGGYYAEGGKSSGRSKGGSGGSGGSEGGGGGGGGGGFYAQQQPDGGGGYPGGAGGGGGFYAQQQRQEQPAGGGFYAQQGAATGGGGFYAQQDTGGSGFYGQQAGGGFYAQQGGSGGFYAQQGANAGVSGGGFYAQQGGGGGFYAQQGGGGGGFYDQGGNGGKGPGRGQGGWGGRNHDLPPTAKGWSKGGR